MTIKKKAVSTMITKKIFNKIKDCSGGYIRLYFYSDPDQDGMLFIVNRGNNISNQFRKISVTNGFESGIREVSLSSNLDSDMIALAACSNVG